MKHNIRITVFIVLLFILAQVIGLWVTQEYVDIEATEQTGSLTFEMLPFNAERPDIEPAYSYIYIAIAVIIGTLILLAIIKFRRVGLWKLWFFLAVAATLTVSFGAFLSDYAALALGIILALWKIIKPNVIIHNITELFIYAGLAAIFVPVMNILSALILLVLISLYDMFAVWKSKHMIKMAKFQTQSRIFAGLSLPYTSSAKGKKVKKAKQLIKKKIKTAVLGGGDIGFPLLFAGAVMKTFGLPKAFIISLFAAVGLTVLLLAAKKDRFYPAMPFITIGCVVGYLVVLVV